MDVVIIVNTVAVNTTKSKRGPGRPRKGCINLAEERARVQSAIQDNAKRLGAINFEEAEEGLDTMLSEDKLKQCTRAELKELRRMAERLWDQFEIEKQYAEDLEWSYGVRREPTPKSIEWDRQHEFLKPKRKNAKKTKTIYDLTDKQKERKGMALEQTPMEFDVEATEAELAAKLVEEAAAKRVEEGHFLKGRRLTGRKKLDPKQPQQKSFWI